MVIYKDNIDSLKNQNKMLEAKRVKLNELLKGVKKTEKKPTPAIPKTWGAERDRKWSPKCIQDCPQNWALLPPLKI